MATWRKRGQTQLAQPLSARKREVARGEAITAIMKLQNGGGAFLTGAAGSKVTLEVATDIEHEI